MVLFTETLVTMQDRSKPPNDKRPAADTSRALPFESLIESAWPSTQWREVHVAVAVSGGTDSVALLRSLHAIKQRSGGRGSLTVLHFDHGIRGEASIADAQWVTELADKLGLDCRTGTTKLDTAASEENLRDARRQFYRDETDQLGARYLATGHTADDQAETVLFRVLRGSGLRGLAGIRPTAPLTKACALVRPLLSLTRAQIEAYLNELGQSHRDDASNQETDYARNWLRHRVLPLAEERFPEARRQLSRVAEHAAESAECLEALAAELLNETCRDMSFDRRCLASRPPGLVAEAIRLAWRRSGWPEQAMTAPAWRRLAELARSAEPHPAEMFAGGIRAESIGDRLVLSRPTAD